MSSWWGPPTCPHGAVACPTDAQLEAIDLRMELRMAIAHASAALAALEDEHEGDTTSCVHALNTCATVALQLVTHW